MYYNALTLLREANKIVFHFKEIKDYEEDC